MAVAAWLLASGACSKSPREIGESRTVPAEPVPNTTSAERFGFTNRDAASGAHDHGAEPAYAWQVPAGWRELPPTPMRAASFAVARAPEIDCSITILPAGGGGIEANLNRWRKQMSLADLTAEEFRAVRTLPVLGGTGLWLECEGTYRGMGNEAPREGAKLLGVAVEDGANAVFVKLVGPAAQVDGERAQFESLCRSLVRALDAHAHAHAEEGTAAPPPAAAPAPGTGAASGTPTRWEVPHGWTRVQSSAMRLVSFEVGANRDTECYVTVLDGSGGGLAANINRWRRQMAQPDLSPAEIASLPEIPMLGTRGRIVAIRGDFTGMDGASQQGAMMLGAVCELPNRSVFVKMVGPVPVVAREEERFAAFCRSLE